MLLVVLSNRSHVFRSWSYTCYTGARTPVVVPQNVCNTCQSRLNKVENHWMSAYHDYYSMHRHGIQYFCHFVHVPNLPPRFERGSYCKNYQYLQTGPLQLEESLIVNQAIIDMCCNPTSSSQLFLMLLALERDWGLEHCKFEVILKYHNGLKNLDNLCWSNLLVITVKNKAITFQFYFLHWTSGFMCYYIHHNWCIHVYLKAEKIVWCQYTPLS